MEPGPRPSLGPRAPGSMRENLEPCAGDGGGGGRSIAGDVLRKPGRSGHRASRTVHRAGQLLRSSPEAHSHRLNRENSTPRPGLGGIGRHAVTDRSRRTREPSQPHASRTIPPGETRIGSLSVPSPPGCHAPASAPRSSAPGEVNSLVRPGRPRRHRPISSPWPTGGCGAVLRPAPAGRNAMRSTRVWPLAPISPRASICPARRSRHVPRADLATTPSSAAAAPPAPEPASDPRRLRGLRPPSPRS